MILKMPFLNQGPVSTVILHLARRVPSEMKIMKINPRMVLDRPGGMREGAGGDMRGSEIYEGLWFRVRHAGLLYETGGGFKLFNRSAHSAGPVKRESEQGDICKRDKR